LLFCEGFLPKTTQEIISTNC